MYTSAIICYCCSASSMAQFCLRCQGLGAGIAWSLSPSQCTWLCTSRLATSCPAGHLLKSWLRINFLDQEEYIVNFNLKRITVMLNWSSEHTTIRIIPTTITFRQLDRTYNDQLCLQIKEAYRMQRQQQVSTGRPKKWVPDPSCDY